METCSALLAICAGNSPVNSSHKGKGRTALMFPLICAWINNCANNREAGDLRHHRAHFDVTACRYMCGICLLARRYFASRSLAKCGTWHNHNIGYGIVGSFVLWQSFNFSGLPKGSCHAIALIGPSRQGQSQTTVINAKSVLYWYIRTNNVSINRIINCLQL